MQPWPWIWWIGWSWCQQWYVTWLQSFIFKPTCYSTYIVGEKPELVDELLFHVSGAEEHSRKEDRLDNTESTEEMKENVEHGEDMNYPLSTEQQAPDTEACSELVLSVSTVYYSPQNPLVSGILI